MALKPDPVIAACALAMCVLGSTAAVSGHILVAGAAFAIVLIASLIMVPEQDRKRWVCRAFGHRMKYGPWWHTDGSWKVEGNCSRCKAHAHYAVSHYGKEP